MNELSEVFQCLFCLKVILSRYERVLITNPYRVNIKRQLPEQIITELLIPIILLCLGNNESGLSLLFLFSQLLTSIVQTVLSPLLQISQLDLISFLLDRFGGASFLNRLANHLRNGLNQSITSIMDVHVSSSSLSSHLHAWPL